MIHNIDLSNLSAKGKIRLDMEAGVLRAQSERASTGYNVQHHQSEFGDFSSAWQLFFAHENRHDDSDGCATDAAEGG